MSRTAALTARGRWRRRSGGLRARERRLRCASRRVEDDGGLGVLDPVLERRGRAAGQWCGSGEIGSITDSSICCGKNSNADIRWCAQTQGRGWRQLEGVG